MFKEMDSYGCMLLVDGLIGYLEIRDWAFEKKSNARPGIDPLDFRMYYFLFFTNWHASIELMRDNLVNDKVKEEFYNDIGREFLDKEDFHYAIYQRNSMVHRGLDPTAMGVVNDGIVVAVSPVTLFKRDNKTSFVCSCSDLFQLAGFCLRAANKILQSKLQNAPEFDYRHQILSKSQTMKMLSDAPHVPEWVMNMADKAFESMDFSQMTENLARGRIARLRCRLSIQ